MTHRGGALFPERWTVDRTRFDGGWALRPGGRARGRAGRRRKRLPPRPPPRAVPRDGRRAVLRVHGRAGRRGPCGRASRRHSGSPFASAPFRPAARGARVEDARGRTVRLRRRRELELPRCRFSRRSGWRRNFRIRRARSGGRRVAMIGPISAIVPSLGHSPWQDEMLDALRRELAGGDAELVWVHQGTAPAPILDRPPRAPRAPAAGGRFRRRRQSRTRRSRPAEHRHRDRQRRPHRRAGLARGARRRARPAPARSGGAGGPSGARPAGAWSRAADSAGTAPGRRCRSAPASHRPPRRAAPFELFGVSATAALYRREALAGASSSTSDSAATTKTSSSPCGCAKRSGRAGACPRRAPGMPARRRPAGRPSRAGGRSIATGCWSCGACSGSEFAATLPRLAARDLRDLLRAGLRFDGARALGVRRRLGAAVPRLAAFAPPSRAGQPARARCRRALPDRLGGVTTPELSTIVVAWRAADDVAELVAALAGRPALRAPRRRPGRRSPAAPRRGAGGRGSAATTSGCSRPAGTSASPAARISAPARRAPSYLLFLNPDARPAAGALAAAPRSPSTAGRRPPAWCRA